MKKKIAKLLLLVMAAGTILSGCGANRGGDKESGYQPADAVTALSDVWAAYGEDEKFFAMGGDYNNITDNTPGTFDVTAVEDMDAMVGIPADAAAMVDDAATLLHAMNANTFTGAVFHVKDGEDVGEFANLVKENILNRQWICGFPDKLTIANMNDQYVAVAFGAADIMSTFEGHLTTVTGAELVVEENLAE